MASKVEEQMDEEGVKLMKNTIIKSVNKLGEKNYEVELEVNKKSI